MSELLSKVAEILKAPEELVQRSAEARAEASGKSVDEVLQSWAGGEAIESSPAAETPVEETPVTPTEVVEEEVAKGTLWVGDYRCPECDGDRIFVVLMQTRSSDEPETKICTCEGCGHKFREYQ